MKFKLFVLFVFPCFCLGNEDFCRETKSSCLFNRALVGHVIRTSITRGVFACAHNCLALSSCSSYNYETSAAHEGVCELNNPRSQNFQQDLKEKLGFVFAQIQRKQEPRSCVEAWKRGARASGFFCIRDGVESLRKMYCDLAFESGWAWTLVMSQSLENSAETFAQTALFVDSPKNAEAPNWDAYRLPLNKMEELRNLSTHWRITCNFPSQGVDYRDYARAEFKQFDVLTFAAGRICKQMEYINVRGHVCKQCTAAWGQKTSLFLTHRSDVNECDRGRTPGCVVGEQTFGRYKKGQNPEFRCTSGQSATTNYWFGSRMDL